jgi:hypothetical protein
MIKYIKELCVEIWKGVRLVFYGYEEFFEYRDSVKREELWVQHNQARQ